MCLSPCRSVQCGVITKCCCRTEEKTYEVVASWVPQGHHLWFTECLSHRFLEGGRVCREALLYFCLVLSLFHHCQLWDPGWTFDLAWPGSHVGLWDSLRAKYVLLCLASCPAEVRGPCLTFHPLLNPTIPRLFAAVGPFWSVNTEKCLQPLPVASQGFGVCYRRAGTQ